MVEERDLDVLICIVARCKRINEKNNNISYEDFCNNYDISEIICFNLVQIGELVNKFSDDFKTKHKDENWKSMIGMRNRIVHGYETIDFETIYDTMNKDIPNLLDYCLSIINNNKS